MDAHILYQHTKNAISFPGPWLHFVTNHDKVRVQTDPSFSPLDSSPSTDALCNPGLVDGVHRVPPGMRQTSAPPPESCDHRWLEGCYSDASCTGRLPWTGWFPPGSQDVWFSQDHLHLTILHLTVLQWSEWASIQQNQNQIKIRVYDAIRKAEMNKHL